MLQNLLYLVVVFLNFVAHSNVYAVRFLQKPQLQINEPFIRIEGTLPVVIWHGMGDSCCNPQGIGAIQRLIEEKLGVFVYSIATGSDEMWDIVSSYFGDVNDQIALVCAKLRNVTELSHGFHAVGFSQGGQFFRAVVERCHHTLPPIHTLVTLGAQHQGVMTIPGCNEAPPATLSGEACRLMQSMLGSGAYMRYVRDYVVQAQYFKDPYRLTEYVQYNPFLPDINNEHEEKKPLYRNNLLALKKLALYKFDQDTTVVPRDSAWFWFFNGTTMVPLEQQPLWQDDWLGLRALHERGDLYFGTVPGQHMAFSLSWFEKEIIEQFLV